ncbi:MAG: acyl-CoA thioesterase [Paracoccaceae bacterium]|nr:MAG: acyl-CoA thioesterase [Paracoccaceae bacterium]
MTWLRDNPVEFNHCDPAGIVFYPRYFEMTNATVENFFREVIGFPFARMVAEGRGVPTARIAIDFTAPSRLGEVLTFSLDVTRLGRTSVTLAIAATCAGAPRLNGMFTLVWVNAQGRPDPWPAEMQRGFTQHLVKEGSE